METPKNHCDSTEESDLPNSSNVNNDFTENNSQNHESKPKNDDKMSKSSSDALAKGLSTMLASVIRDFDSKAQDTIKSLDQLNSAIDRLTRELDQLLEDALCHLLCSMLRRFWELEREFRH